VKYLFLLSVLITSSCNQNTVRPLELLGNWGNENENTELLIGSEKAVFNFTCGSAEINKDISKENPEIFIVEGTYMQQFGNIPEDYDPTKYIYAAIFTFTQSKGILKVEITKKMDASPLGFYNYIRGEKVLVKKCP
jgi:hypothetical protein